MVCDPWEGSVAPFCFSTIWYSARWGGNLPLSNRGTGTEAFSISNRVRLDILCFLKETPPPKKFLLWITLTIKSSEMSCLFLNNAACSCCEIKDWIIAWQMCFVDHAAISLHCCGEEINISTVCTKLTYVFCISGIVGLRLGETNCNYCWKKATRFRQLNVL